jgi:YegS/Rv2252/BmrU family lipid kinase
MYYYIVNPAAGGGRINKIQDRLQDRLKKLGIMGEFVKSTGPDDVAKLARLGIERGFKTIVAVGGDGTINEVMNAIIDNDRIALGIIPTGTTNDLADALGIADWYAATGILASRKIEQIDLGSIGEKFFVTSATIGFDSKISNSKRLTKGNVAEKIKYGVKIFKEAAAYKPIKAYLKFDGNYEVEADCFNLIISNSTFFPLSGIASKIGDNLLDTVIITKIPGSKIFKYSFLADDSAIDLPKISVFRSKKIEVTTKEPADVFADGQFIQKTPVTVNIADKKIRVIVSRKHKF